MSLPKTKLVFVHLMDDLSGSPKVLSQVIDHFANQGHPADLFTSSTGNKGFLQDLKGVNRVELGYKRHENKWLQLYSFLASQVALFFMILKYRKEDAIIYVNTLLPFGAALAGKLTGRKVIYHIHETSLNPRQLKWFLKKVAQFCATKAYYVSGYLKQAEELIGVPGEVVYNSLTPEFIEKSSQSIPSLHKPFTVLMLCSLRTYKGVNDFVELARKLPNLQFVLVVNASSVELDQFFIDQSLPSNLELHAATKNVHPFYEKAHLVLNLSHPDQWVETFGLTALEALSYGLPVIVPPVGGITEVIEDQRNGYAIHVDNKGEMVQKIDQLARNEQLYEEFSRAARTGSRFFTPEVMNSRIEQQTLSA
ncbi:glycosyltransferase family 4 protein [bacterium SCSIO 12741]|nr:glycosyltransferase family 4 protein [bacterium SCSIO 12741]